MKIKTRVKAGALTINHNAVKKSKRLAKAPRLIKGKTLAVRTGIRAGWPVKHILPS